MTAMRKMTFELPEDLAVEIDAEIASGAYDDIDQFVIESLESRLHPDRQAARNPEIERWLVQEVGPTYDAYKADPSRLMTEEDVFDGLEERLSSRVDQARRGTPFVSIRTPAQTSTTCMSGLREKPVVLSR